jgi:hypothetical protein
MYVWKNTSRLDRRQRPGVSKQSSTVVVVAAASGATDHADTRARFVERVKAERQKTDLDEEHEVRWVCRSAGRPFWRAGVGSERDRVMRAFGRVRFWCTSRESR